MIVPCQLLMPGNAPGYVLPVSHTLATHTIASISDHHDDH